MNLSINAPLVVKVGARDSKLSRAQVEEVQRELQFHHPHVALEPIWLKTLGDKDLTTSLRTLGKTDFFTKEIDVLLLNNQCRVAIHSAKDLPEPMPTGLVVIALTKGVDPADVLVFRSGENLSTLSKGALIGSSCERRDSMVKALRSDLRCVDVRGTVDRRLFLLDTGIIDGLVAAEAGLIRLGLTHRGRICLEGESAALQGRLAIVACQDDLEIAQLFSCLNV